MRFALILIGVALLVVGGVIGASVRSFLRTATAADGVVARLNAGGSHPQIEFTTAAGRRVSYPQGGFISGYKPGDKVRVLYRDEAPEQTARLDSFGALWFAPLLLGLLGLGFVAAGGSLRWFEVSRPGAAVSGQR
jgi:hypothetical protein